MSQGNPEAPVVIAAVESVTKVDTPIGIDTERAAILAAVRALDTQVEAEPDERQPTPGGLANGYFPNVPAGVPVYERYEGQLA